MTRVVGAVVVGAVVVGVVVVGVVVVGAVVVGAVVGAAAAEPGLPVRASDRPATLPAAAARLDLDLDLARAPGGGRSWSSVLGGGVGVTAGVEVGGQLVSATLAPAAAVGEPLLYATWAWLAPGTWTVTPALQVAVPVHAADAWSVDGVVAIADTVGAWTISAAPTVSATWAAPVAVTATVPVQVALQVSRRLVATAQSGVGFARFDPRQPAARVEDALDLNEATLPLGAAVVYTVGRDDGPFADLGVQLQFPALLQADPAADTFAPGDWNLLVTVSGFRAAH